MNPTSNDASHFSSTPRATQLWASAQAGSKPLAYTALGLLICAALTSLLIAADPRLFQGVSVWWKPWKFQLSTGVFLWTLAYFMAFLPATQRTSYAAKYIVWGSLLASAYEIIYITVQAALGQASHFNVATPLLGLAYNVMALGALMLTVAALVLGVLIFKHAKNTLSNAMRHAITWGLLASFALGSFTGMYVGSKRTTGHWVGGVASDAGGWLIFNWSRTGGDLRVAHFFSLHAMQILPLFALGLVVLSARSSAFKLSDTALTRWVWAASLAYSAFCIATFVQAVRGIPFA